MHQFSCYQSILVANLFTRSYENRLVRNYRKGAQECYSTIICQCQLDCCQSNPTRCSYLFATTGISFRKIISWPSILASGFHFPLSKSHLIKWKCNWPLLQFIRTIVHSSSPELLFICSIKYVASFFDYHIIDINESSSHIFASR